MDLFGGLVNGVFDFLKFYFADYVEAVVGCHDVFSFFFAFVTLSFSIMAGSRVWSTS
jgi:hypothetical protein